MALGLAERIGLVVLAAWRFAPSVADLVAGSRTPWRCECSSGWSRPPGPSPRWPSPRRCCWRRPSSSTTARSAPACPPTPTSSRSRPRRRSTGSAETAGSAHAFLPIAAVDRDDRDRRAWRCAVAGGWPRVLLFIGLAVVVAHPRVDAPQGPRRGRRRRSSTRAPRRACSGAFWVQLACGVVIAACGLAAGGRAAPATAPGAQPLALAPPARAAFAAGARGPGRQARERVGADAGVRLERLLPIACLVAAALLFASELMTTFEFIPPGGEATRSQSAGDRHGYAQIVLAAFAVVALGRRGLRRLQAGRGRGRGLRRDRAADLPPARPPRRQRRRHPRRRAPVLLQRRGRPPGRLLARAGRRPRPRRSPAIALATPDRRRRSRLAERRSRRVHARAAGPQRSAARIRRSRRRGRRARARASVVTPDVTRRRSRTDAPPAPLSARRAYQR